MVVSASHTRRYCCPGLLLHLAIVLAACGGGSAANAATSPPVPPVYNFAGVRTNSHADTVEGIRATITWSVAPITSSRSAQSTWIGIFGQGDPTTHLSVKIAQIGWKQLAPKPPRVFWEWGTDRTHVSISYGDTVEPSKPLVVELDRDITGEFSFLANGVLVGHVALTWAPTFLDVAAETHQPSDLMAGSAQMPEVISDLKWKLNGEWQAFTATSFSTSSQYQATIDSTGNVLIWDTRARTP